MAGRVQPFEAVYKGESKTLLFTVLDDDHTKSTIIVIDGVAKTFKGARLDLSSATVIEWQVNLPVGPPYTAVIAKSLAGGVTLANQADPDTKGDLLVVLAPADTAALPEKIYKHDLWITMGGIRRCVVRPSDFPLREPVNGP